MRRNDVRVRPWASPLVVGVRLRKNVSVTRDNIAGVPECGPASLHCAVAGGPGFGVRGPGGREEDTVTPATAGRLRRGEGRQVRVGMERVHRQRVSPARLASTGLVAMLTYGDPLPFSNSNCRDFSLILNTFLTRDRRATVPHNSTQQ